MSHSPYPHGDFFLIPKMKLNLKGRRFDTIEEIQAEYLRDTLKKRTSRKCSNCIGDGETCDYMRVGTTLRVMVADRSYGDFYDF
jgi:hypothetical protein